MADATIAHARLLEQLRALGVRRGDVLQVHTAFSRVGPVAGGPEGLIDALLAALGSEGTLVMPTMTAGDAPFDPAVTPTHEMGVTAELFWRRPGVIRSSHPGASFAACGPVAERICAPQPLSPPHGPDSPVGRVRDLEGKVLLLGVEHSENTTMHLAEWEAEVPYRVEHPCVVERDGRAVTVMIPETDHCCRGFRMAEAWLRAAGVQRDGRVGNADARLCGARGLVEIVTARLRRDPLIFLCGPGAGCAECSAARSSISSA